MAKTENGAPDITKAPTKPTGEPQSTQDEHDTGNPSEPAKSTRPHNDLRTNPNRRVRVRTTDRTNGQ